MALDEVHAAANAIEWRLDNDALWESRIHFGNVPPSVAMPYVWIVFQGGGEQNNDLHADPLLVMAVTATADNPTDAFLCKQRIADLLDDAGLHDRFPAVTGLGGWHFRTISKGPVIYIEDSIDNAARVYRAGNQYLFDMEQAT
jgi:hypothetical protein